MATPILPSDIKTGDKIRFTSDFLEVYSREIDPDYCKSLGEFQEVRLSRVNENCPEEYYNFYLFPKMPGNLYFAKQSDNRLGIFEIED